MKRDDRWKAWAIGGIWIGVGLSAFGAGFFTVFIAICAMEATEYVTKS